MRLRDKWNVIILGRRDINESDRLLTVFSREKGLAKLIAKGVRKIPSRRGGHVEPFMQVRCIVTGHPERMYLQAAEAFNDHLLLRQDSEAVQHAQFLAGTVCSFYQEGDPDEEMYTALQEAWMAFPEVSFEKRVVLETALSLYVLRANGVQPVLRSCQVCGESSPSDAVILDATAGGWHCLSCRMSLEGARVSITPRLLKAVRWLSANPDRALALRLPEEEARQLQLAVRGYVSAMRNEYFQAERSKISV